MITSNILDAILRFEFTNFNAVSRNWFSRDFNHKSGVIVDCLPSQYLLKSTFS